MGLLKKSGIEEGLNQYRVHRHQVPSRKFLPPPIDMIRRVQMMGVGEWRTGGGEIDFFQDLELCTGSEKKMNS